MVMHQRPKGMYDKVSFWMERGAVGGDLSAVPGYLDAGEERRDIVTGAVRFTGNLGPLSVNLYPHGLSIYGSLPKFLLGDNVGTLSRRDTARAVEALSDALHVDISGADITTLEFGTNYLMKQEPRLYFHCLGGLSRMNRIEFEQSLYYQGRGRKKPFVVAFYDKTREVEKDGETMPYNLNGTNVLRYEIRARGKIASRMKRPEVKAATLADKLFYRDMLGLYTDSYKAIQKVMEVKTDNIGQIKTVSDAFDMFVARLINQSGNGQISAFLDELRGAEVFKDKKYYTRLKKRLQEAAQSGGVTVSDEMLAELDNEIKNVGAYY